MAKFEIVYESGRTEVVEQSDCATIEQFINTKFGTVKTKAKVSLFGEKKFAEKEPVKPAKKPSAKVEK